MTEDATKLRAAIKRSGLSLRKFSTDVMGRNPRSVSRWLAGSAMPAVVRQWLARYLKSDS